MTRPSALLGVLALCLLAPAGFSADPPAKGKAEVLDAAALAARIDGHIETKWKQNKVTPAMTASDAELVRRVYLDIRGRIPSTEEVYSFLRNKSANKRIELVDELLGLRLPPLGFALKPQGYVSHFTNSWRDLVLPQGNNQIFQQFETQLETWLANKFRANVPFDRMVRELLTADPIAGRRLQRPGQPVEENYDPAVVAFYQANELKPENIAAATSRLFLGIKLECAQCHDHPFNQYSREQFWQYTAFFAGISPNRQDGNRFVQAGNNPKIRELKIPGTERVVKAKFLDGKDPKLDDQSDPRAALADWMTAADNQWFARNIVNRTWAHFFGYGIIDPVDEPGDANPASHPELLDELARQFVLNKYDLKYLVRAITGTKAYQLTSTVSHPTQSDPRFFAVMNVKGLTPEQLYSSMEMATGYQAPNAGQIQAQFRQRFGTYAADFRQKFANFADRKTEYQTSILQALTLMNGAFMAENTRPTDLDPKKSRTLGAVVDNPFMTTEAKLEALYMATLSRSMRPDEASRLTRYVDKGGPSGDPQKALGDVFWALLNSSEFLLNH